MRCDDGNLHSCSESILIVNYDLEWIVAQIAVYSYFHLGASRVKIIFVRTTAFVSVLLALFCGTRVEFTKPSRVYLCGLQFL